jgi:hypothetical protein
MFISDPDAITATEELELRGLLDPGNAIEVDIYTAMVTFSSLEAIAWMKNTKIPRVREHENQELKLFGRIQHAFEKEEAISQWISAKYTSTMAAGGKLRGTDLLVEIAVEFSHNTELERQRKLELCLKTRLAPSQSGTKMCVHLEKTVLELIRLGHPVTLDIFAVNQMFTIIKMT